MAGAPALTADEFDLFEGGDKVNKTLCVCPLLISYVADESKKEADVSKAARKAREEKFMAATGMNINEIVSRELVRGDPASGGGAAEGVTPAPKTRQRRR